jgi:hypothetical protein
VVCTEVRILSRCPECGAEEILTKKEYERFSDLYVYKTRCAICGCGDACSWTTEEVPDRWNDFVQAYCLKCCGASPLIIHDVRKSKHVENPKTIILCDTCGRSLRMVGGNGKKRLEDARREWNLMIAESRENPYE